METGGWLRLLRLVGTAKHHLESLRHPVDVAVIHDDVSLYNDVIPITGYW